MVGTMGYLTLYELYAINTVLISSRKQQFVELQGDGYLCALTAEDKILAEIERRKEFETKKYDSYDY